MIVAHAGGLDELAILGVPAILGIGLFFIFRSGKDEDQDADTPAEER